MVIILCNNSYGMTIFFSSHFPWFKFLPCKIMIAYFACVFILFIHSCECTNIIHSTFNLTKTTNSSLEVLSSVKEIKSKIHCAGVTLKYKLNAFQVKNDTCFMGPYRSSQNISGEAFWIVTSTEGGKLMNSYF